MPFCFQRSLWTTFYSELWGRFETLSLSSSKISLSVQRSPATLESMFFFFLRADAVGKEWSSFVFLPFLSVPRLDEGSLAFSIPYRWMSLCCELTSSPGAICECCSLCDSFEELTALTFQPSASKKKTRQFREQRGEQVVLPPVVRRVLIVGRTDRPRLWNYVEIGCTDARVGLGQVHCRSSKGPRV